MEKRKKNEDSISGLIILLIVITIVWLLAMCYLKITIRKWDSSATFGDTFEVINSLFSGLALGGIIFTILQQKKELMLQREEISKTREEFITQNTTLRLQRFENTFFNLLSLHHQIVDAIDLDIDRAKRVDGIAERMLKSPEYEIISIKGRDVFKLRFEKLNETLLRTKGDLNTEYLKFYENVQTDFGHYFRNLYRIIKMVDETEFVSYQDLEIEPNSVKRIDSIKYHSINYNYRYKYTSMVRAQLSDYELLWLFFNCLSDNGREKFKPLLEKYTFFKNMPLNKIYDSGLIKLYDVKAFRPEE